jgi:hypothetical protein
VSLAVLEWVMAHTGRRSFLFSVRPAIDGPGPHHIDHLPQPGPCFSSTGARMASKGLRVASEGSSIEPWQMIVQTDQKRPHAAYS